MKNVIKYIKEKIPAQETCLLALSGGPDSMCMLKLLKEANRQVVCVHINHNTRENNDKEYAFVKEYTKQNNIPLLYYKIPSYKKNKFTEEEGRAKRYQKIFALAKKEQIKYVITAHHADDLLETIIMRLLRGSSLEGYAGFKKEMTYDNITILRPLITKTKQEIYTYIHQNNIPYVLDETNDLDIHLRNRIRHYFIPWFAKENAKYPQKIEQFSETLIEKNEVVTEYMRVLAKKIMIKDQIDLTKLLTYKVSVQKTFIEYVFQKIYQNNIDQIANKHRDLVWKLANNPKRNVKLNLPLGFVAIKNDNFLEIKPVKAPETYCLKCLDETILPNKDLVIRQAKYTEKSNYEIHLNSKDLALPLYITTRKKGMKMAVKNLNGQKKIKDILIDEKVSQAEKDEIPILIDSKGTVLWVLGLKKSKYDLEKGENYDIIYKYIKRKEN